MTPIDAKVIPIIREAIAKYGKLVTFTVHDAAYDPSTGGTQGGGTPYDVKVTPPAQFDETEVDGDAIRRGDVKVYVQKDGLPFDEPVPQQQVTIDGHQWRIITVQPIYSGELIALYGLQMRK